MLEFFFSYDLITQWLKNINSMVPILWNLLWFATWFSICFIFGYVPYTLEDNMYSAIVGCSVLCVVRLSRNIFTDFFVSFYQLLRALLTSLIMKVDLPISLFLPSFGALYILKWCYYVHTHLWLLCISVEQPFCYPALFHKVCFLIH